MAERGGGDVVIVEAVRTAVGRGHPEKGYYRDVHPSALLASIYADLLERAGIDPTAVDEAIAGCVNQLGEQGLNIGRNAWLQAGLPLETPASTLDLQCGSSQQAVNIATGMIAGGAVDVVVAAGVEHMGRISLDDAAAAQEEHGDAHTPELLERYGLVPQGIAAERIADRWEVSRAELDEIGLRSHRLAARATEEGRFEREIAPFRGDGESHEIDQGIRPDTSLEALSRLRPAFEQGGKVTAGNSSQVSDGAAAVLLARRDRAEELGLTPRARVVDQVAVGVDPVSMLTGPIPATRRLLERNGLAVGDVDVFEVNEAFASVIAAWRRELSPEMDRVNPNGGAIALGHPLGASGARLMTTLLHELERGKGEIGLQTMCCAGGIGTGTLIQLV